MAISDLLRALETEAADRAHALHGEALAEAAALRDEATRNDAAALEAELSAHRATVQAAADAQVSAAARVYRARVLEARSESLELLRGAVRTVLPGLLERDDAAALFDALVNIALSARGDGAAVMRVPARWLARARDRAPGVDLVADDAVGTGVRLQLDGGRVVVDATLEALLERFWPRLRIAALEALR